MQVAESGHAFHRAYPFPMMTKIARRLTILSHTTGPTVNAVLDTTTCDRSITITDKQITALEATPHRHEFHATGTTRSWPTTPRHARWNPPINGVYKIGNTPDCSSPDIRTPDMESVSNR